MCSCMQQNTCITWILENEVLLNMAISFLSFVVTSILTIVIIVQTSRLAKKQSRQDVEINKQQENLQRRQMQIDTFEYKNNIYHALYRVFQLTGEIEHTFSKISLQEKQMEQLYQIFDALRDQLKIDVSETLWLFKQAEYILPPSIFSSVYDIAGNFNELTGDIGKFNLYPKVLTPDLLEDEKRLLLGDVLSRSKQINSHVPFIEKMMKSELDISSLAK